MNICKYECNECLFDFYIDNDFGVDYCPFCGERTLKRNYDEDNSVQPECE